MADHLFLYGPPGSGKSVVGSLLAGALALPFVDLDEEIAARAGRSIADIFTAGGEAAFRQMEIDALRSFAARPAAVVSLGGGALLAPEARAAAEENGQVLCLQASFEALFARVQNEAGRRPLLADDPPARLNGLLAARAEHYRSFALRLDTSALTPPEAAWQAQVLLGRFRVRGMGSEYAVRVQPRGLDQLGADLQAQRLNGPVALVCDENTAPLYAARAQQSIQAAGYEVFEVTLPAGERNKTVEAVQRLWAAFAQARLERGSTVVALGGGVVGDLAGFASATFLRGVNWVNVPTTLLAMVNSSLGGKTGFDLPQGKNLVGAFYAPRLVLADPLLIGSLPRRELRSGLAETIKHGIIADPALFTRCAEGIDAAASHLNDLVRRGMAVKVQVIEADPYERGQRQSLNLGHTVGHGVELASGFSLSHGEAVAVGMAVEAGLAEQIGVAAPGLADQICTALRALELPVEIPAELPRAEIIAAMKLDKKRAGGVVRFALPEKIGSVRVGIQIEGWEERI